MLLAVSDGDGTLRGGGDDHEESGRASAHELGAEVRDTETRVDVRLSDTATFMLLLALLPSFRSLLFATAAALALPCRLTVAERIVVFFAVERRRLRTRAPTAVPTCQLLSTDNHHHNILILFHTNHNIKVPAEIRRGGSCFQSLRQLSYKTFLPLPTTSAKYMYSPIPITTNRTASMHNNKTEKAQYPDLWNPPAELRISVIHWNQI